jgi:hypothetical protein
MTSYKPNPVRRLWLQTDQFPNLSSVVSLYTSRPYRDSRVHRKDRRDISVTNRRRSGRRRRPPTLRLGGWRWSGICIRPMEIRLVIPVDQYPDKDGRYNDSHRDQAAITPLFRIDSPRQIIRSYSSAIHASGAAGNILPGRPNTITAAILAIKTVFAVSGLAHSSIFLPPTICCVCSSVCVCEIAGFWTQLIMERSCLPTCSI